MSPRDTKHYGEGDNTVIQLLSKRKTKRKGVSTYSDIEAWRIAEMLDLSNVTDEASLQNEIERKFSQPLAENLLPHLWKNPDIQDVLIENTKVGDRIQEARRIPEIIKELPRGPKVRQESKQQIQRRKLVKEAEVRPKETYKVGKRMVYRSVKEPFTKLEVKAMLNHLARGTRNNAIITRDLQEANPGPPRSIGSIKSLKKKLKAKLEKNKETQSEILKRYTGTSNRYKSTQQLKKRGRYKGRRKGKDKT